MLKSTRPAASSWPTREEMIGRARELAPALSARAAEAERLRRLPEVTIGELHEAGLFRVFQPRRVGGGELDYGLFIEIGAALGAACASSAWVWANLAGHHWMLALWPERAQAELWDADPNVVIGSSLVFPSGRARKVAGGYELSGCWPFSSGIVHASWMMAGGMVTASEGRPTELRMFLIPSERYRVIDTWHVSGLRGTGSHDVEVDGAFVADDFTLSVENTKRATAPGLAVNPGPLYRIPVFATFPYLLLGVLLGAAEGAVDHYVMEARERVSKYSGARIAELSPVQIKIAEASASCAAARLISIEDCRVIMAAALENKIVDEEQRARYHRNAAFAAKHCVEAVDLVTKAAGGSGLYDRNPLQRAFRDVHAGVTHISLVWDAQAALYGRIALGLPSNNSLI